MKTIHASGGDAAQIYIGNLRNVGAAFEKYLTQIGYLSQDTIESVYKTYNNVKAKPDELIVVLKARHLQDSRDYYEVKNLGAAIKMIESTVAYLQKAIDGLEADLRTPGSRQ